MEKVWYGLILASFAVYAFTLLKKELHMMQLNSYRNSRYRRWTQKNFNQKFTFSIFLLITGGVLVLLNVALIPAYIGWIGGASLGAYRLLTEKHKKKLVFTRRAKTLFFTSLGVFLAIAATLALLLPLKFVMLGWALMSFIAFSWLIIANFLLIPVERRIAQWYKDDAKRILQSMPHLKVIGITGSYGKTSVKHFLTRILSEKYNVVMTPGSYNTPMGVTITVRNHLKPIHEVFVCEMGAKQIGDIKELCDLANPEIGILTAVADQHLDTFGSIQNVQKGKFELIDALPSHGVGYMNFDYEYVRNHAPITHVENHAYSLNQDTAYQAKNVEYTPKGMKFSVYYQNEKVLDLETKLMGEANISNILVCCAVALKLEVPVKSIQFAVKNLQPVKHRMELKRNPGGITILDDAFNSNPTGAKMALEVLKKIEGGQKVIITPGMIELAEKEYELNRILGEQIAEHVDYAILVGPKQTLPIQEGLKNKNYPEDRLYVARNLTDANQHLMQIAKAGDVVLYENDLPDTFNE
ncbi:hypothetical protein BKI52_34655 [marine bacterium AO1-C]|nr:hypothetical protein BKI52_34655 [marine bacterium AO1-C]